MEFSADQINELRRIAPNLSIAQEGGIPYLRIDNLKLPDGCMPSVVNALLCPIAREGYESTLFYSSIITGCTPRTPPHNWNRNGVRILGENWYALSWKVQSGLRLAAMLQIHLSALR